MKRRRLTEQTWRDDPWFKGLCSALKSCKTEEEAANLLRDVGTLSELQAWSERLEVAKHLSRGLSYRQVAESTGASTTTVTRVAKFIENGEGGYRKFLKLQRRSGASAEEEVMQATINRGVQKVSVLHKYLNK